MQGSQASIQCTPEVVRPLLDAAAANLHRLQENGAKQVLPGLSRKLDGLRNVIGDPQRWERFCEEALRGHPLHGLLLEDPFVRHSATRPRGYPGDADLLDYIYGIKEPSAASALGAGLFEYTTNVQSSAAVRERRMIIACNIDETAKQHPEPRILSLAAGHLREAELSSAVKSRTIAELVAFDQDAQSLATINNDYGNGQIKAHHGSVRSLVGEKHTYRDFHFVYAAGLFDYLAERTAKRLTRVMFEMLAPGGSILIANFAPSLEDIGYMEAFMRWHLIYRDEADMASLASEIPPSDISSQKLYWNSTNCMLFLELERKC